MCNELQIQPVISLQREAGVGYYFLPPNQVFKSKALMKQIVVITRAKFWLQGAGFWARSREMLKFLSRQARVNVIYMGPLLKRDISLLRQFEGPIKFIWIGQPGKDEVPEIYWKDQFEKISGRLPEAEIYFIDQISNSFMLDVLPYETWEGQARPRFIVDMHDLVSARTIKHQRYKIQEQFPLSTDEERQILDRYDAVICIQQNEFNQVVQWIGESKCLLVPHPLEPRPQLIREKARNIGFVASRWHANVNGLNRFIKKVWPRLAERGVYLHLHGFIAERFKETSDPQIVPNGYCWDLHRCYEHMDIMINPVFYGAGLKIKSVEAMAHGLPLVTTEEGASGLEHLDGSALLIARSDQQFANILIELIDDKARRERLAQQAINYVTDHLSEQHCFTPLEKFLNT